MELIPFGGPDREGREAGAAGSAIFEYDWNGNMISGAGRTIEFDLMDRPVRVCAATNAPCPAGVVMTEFAYAPDGGRYRQRILGPVDSKFGPKTVYYVDKDYELVPCAAFG